MGTLASLRETLVRMQNKRVYFDTMAVVYVLEQNPLFYDCALPFFEAASDRTVIGFTGVVTLMEMLVKPMRDGRVAFCEQLKGLFESGDFFEMVGHSNEAFTSAAALRAQNNLRAIDALQLATAQALGCQFFVTNDDSFKSNPTMEVVVVRNFHDDPKHNPLLKGRAKPATKQ